jgi:outer membrane protein assembly factor BamB
MTMRSIRLLLIVPAVVALGGCWFQPGFGPERTASNPYENTVGVGNVTTLHQTWSASLDATPGHDPVIAPDRVVVTDSGNVYALDAATGVRDWHVALDPGGIQQAGDATIAGGSVFVPDYGHLSTRRFDLRSGQELDPAARGTYGAAIVRGVRIVSEGQGIGSLHGVFIGVDDLTDPSQSWASTEAIVGAGIGNFPTGAAVADDRFFFGRGGSVVAFPLTPPPCPQPPPPAFPVPCTALWSTAVDFTAAFPVLDGDTVIAGTTTGVTALDAATGAVRWSANLGASVTQAPAVANGTVYAATSAGRLVALAAGGCGNPTCAPVWSATVPSPLSAQLAVANGVVYTGSADGSVRAFAASGCGSGSCSSLWSAQTGSRINGAPAVASGRLVVATDDGRVVAYTASAG